MKKISRFWLLGLALGFAPGFAGDELDAILSKYYAAIGDVAKLKDVKSVLVRGAVKTHSNQMPFSLMVKGKMCRVDWRTPDGVQIVQIFDGKRGWEFNPMLGQVEPTPLDERVVKKLTFLTDLNPLVGWRQKGHTVTYQGAEKIDGELVHRVFLKTAQRMGRTFYFSNKTGLPVMFADRSSYQKGKDVLSKVIAYQKVDGIRYLKTFYTGSRDACATGKLTPGEYKLYREVNYETIKLNPELPEFLFCIEETRASLETAHRQ